MALLTILKTWRSLHTTYPCILQLHIKTYLKNWSVRLLFLHFLHLQKFLNVIRGVISLLSKKSVKLRILAFLHLKRTLKVDLWNGFCILFLHPGLAIISNAAKDGGYLVFIILSLRSENVLRMILRPFRCSILSLHPRAILIIDNLGNRFGYVLFLGRTRN